MWFKLKAKTYDDVAADLLKRAEGDVQALRCHVLEIEDTLAFYRSSLAHAEKRVLDLRLLNNKPEGNNL
jgi:hypothetical protein